jgi:hypothetical protein
LALPSKKPPIIENAWKNYVRLSLDPIGAPAVQRRETKIAFYLGALALFDGIMHNMTPSDDVEEPDLTLLDGIQKELEEFTENMKAGRNP